MGDYSYLIDPQYRFPLIGIILLVIAVLFRLTGETIERFHGVVYRAEEPNRFWWNVATYYLGGVFFIGLFLYKISN
jgi:hypothetical protein